MVHSPLLALTAILSLFSVASHASASSSGEHMVRFHKRASASKYPAANVTPPQSSLPKDWVDALNAAVAAGKIPDIPTSTATSDGVSYASKKVGNSKATCSWTTIKCNGPDDITDAPDGEWTIAFDDGPTGASPLLYQFLQQHNQSGTHFMVSRSRRDSRGKPS
jgi:chitin deacetylase